MRGLKLLGIVVTVIIIISGFRLLKKDAKYVSVHEHFFTVYLDGHFFKVDENGVIYDLDENIGLSTKLVSCVKVDGMKIDKEDFSHIKSIYNVLKSRIVSEVCIRKKVVIALKGVMIYFHKWESLRRYFPEIEKRFSKITPRSVYELFDGSLVELGGG